MDDEKEIEIVADEEEGKADSKFKKLKKELEDCRKEKEEYLAGWQRAKADFINARKDEEKRMEEFAKFSAQNVLRDFLPVADSIDMALKHENSDGLRQIKAQLAETLKRNGAEEIEAGGGLKFNPAEHEAIEEVAVETESEDGVIIEELQKGYKLFNRVIRPSKVKVGVYKIKD